MEKCRIFIASSGRTLTLAEKLRDELQTDFCEATLWSQEGRGQASPTIIEMLEKATAKYDFAVIILAKDDVFVSGAGDTLKARDNCVFEAGLFISAVGRERCFLVNSVSQRDLPSDLGGIISIPFTEPADLTDREACANAIRSVSADVKNRVQDVGARTMREQLQVLSIDDVFKRERPRCDGGDLHEGLVVVADLQPMSDLERGVQVRRNLDSGTSYVYFFPNREDTVEKICQALQVMLVGSGTGNERAADFSSRLATILKERDRVLDDLREICRASSLLISLVPTEPGFCFRLHNASDPELARLYMRFRGGGFIPWAEGSNAVAIWRNTIPFIPGDEERIFVWLKQYEPSGEDKQRFEDSVKRGVKRYFPGMQDEVEQLLMGPK